MSQQHNFVKGFNSFVLTLVYAILVEYDKFDIKLLK